MSKNLLLLTKHFPYNKGETPAESYLENEISILAKTFESVTVIAAEAKNSSQLTCKLPGNVKAFALQDKSSKLVKLSCICKALKLFFTSKPEEILQECKNKNLGFKAKVFLHYFYSRALQKSKKINNLIASGSLNIKKTDAIYSFWLFDNAYAAVLLKKACSLNCKIVSRTHRYDLYEYANSLNYLPMRAYLLENIDRVFPCSENGTQYLSELYPDFSSKIQTSFLGSHDYGLQPFERKKGKLHIVSCSRLIEVKRVNRIIESLQILENEPFEIEWTHIGGGQLMDKIKSDAEQKLKKIKTNLLGTKGNSEVMKLYKKMNVDLFVNVSESEGLPISIMEAVSFGIPVIATDVGGTNEIIKHGLNGFLLEKDFSCDTLNKLILQVCNMSDEEYFSLRQNARFIWENNFDFTENTKAFINSL